MGKRTTPDPKGAQFFFALKVLADDLPQNSDEPKWVHVATEGDYRGYDMGARPFAFTREIFQQIVNNLRAHPSYRASADGVGMADVIPWDFHHASESVPTEGTIPFSGAPAQGWTRELQIREGQSGRCELWALTKFLEPAKTYVKEGKYKWASVCVIFDDVDGVSGDNVGARLTSIALTNVPFIEGMNQLAASKDKRISLRYFYGDPAGSAKGALDSIKELLALPITATASDVMSELNKIGEWSTSGNTPLGIDIEYIFSGLRQIMNVPALRSAPDVIKDIQGLVGGLLAEQALQSGQPIAPPLLSEDNLEVNQMADLLQRLSKELGVRASDDDVVSAVKELLELQKGVKETLGADRTSNDSIIEAAKKAIDEGAKLNALLQALSAKDIDSAVARATDLLGQEKTLTEMAPVLEKYKKDEEDRNEKQAEKDVTEVLSTRKLPEHVKPALLMFRKNDPAKFAETYPKVPADKALLTRDVATQKGGELKVETTPTTPQEGDLIDLANYAGINKMARAISYVESTVKNSAQMTWENKCAAAMNVIRQKNVIDSITDKKVS